jgi:hypothetical protein
LSPRYPDKKYDDFYEPKNLRVEGGKGGGCFSVRRESHSVHPDGKSLALRAAVNQQSNNNQGPLTFRDIV